MEILIITSLLIIVLLLLQDKVIIKWKVKNEPIQEEANPKLPEIMGRPKYLHTRIISNNSETNEPIENAEVNPDDLDIDYDKNEPLYRQIPNEDLDYTFNSAPNFEEEEEEWQQHHLSENDNGFATGVSFEELNTVHKFLEKSHLNQSQKQTTVDIVQRLQGTELFSLLEQSMEGASQKIAKLLESSLLSNSLRITSSQDNKQSTDFNIEEFI